MRYAEFKLIEAGKLPGYYTVGDSHAEGLAAYTGKPWTNKAKHSTKSDNPMHMDAIRQIPKGSVVLISLGANDANATNEPPNAIASRVASIVNASVANGNKTLFLLFPVGTSTATKPERRKAVRDAISSSISVPITDLEGKALQPDGVHAQPNVYNSIGKALARQTPNVSNTPAQLTKPEQSSQPATAGKFNITVPEVSVGRRGAGVMDVQKALQALGYDLGPTGVDGIRGKFTTAAIKKYQSDRGIKVDGDAGPETATALNKDIAENPDKFKSITNSSPSDVKRVNPKAREIDTKAIQDPEFNSKLDKVAKALGIESDILRRIIKFETAGTFSPTSQDPSGVSIGLIGFTRPTARALGTSREELAKMTAVQQLDYVYKFYKMNGLRPGSDIGTMYMLTFMPAYAYSPDNTVLGQKNGGTLGNTGLSLHKIWLQNPAFAKSKGKDFFTVGDVKNMINSRR